MDFHRPDCVKMLDAGWSLILSDANAYASPAEIPAAAEALPAQVPGTVAGALHDAGRFDPARPEPLDHRDAWYRLTLSETPGPAILRFEGLATVAEVWLNGAKLHTSENMYEPFDLPVTLTGTDELAIAFRALRPHLQRKGPRARWRPRMMTEQGLRLVRTTTLGYMPGWCPEIHAVGPWRPVRLIRPDAFSLQDLTISATLSETGDGLLAVSCASPPAGIALAGIALACAGRTAPFEGAEDGRSTARLTLPGVKPWWPATHGEPALYDVTLVANGETVPITRTGFRRIEAERGDDGKDFSIRVNGERIFCRGAVWTTADILRLPGDRASYEPWLRLAAEAGMNMIRIAGTMTYESPDFFALCDELGIMVWQDLMFANFDYPAKDEGFVAHVRAEVSAFLSATAASPSLAVLSGGSEMYQQGAMLGLPESVWKTPLTTEILPALVAGHRPDVAYVENSPSGGAQPFFVDEGIGHYYGVGAYERPLSDARRANVRFAAECLTFANVPQQATLDAYLPVRAVHHPDWKARTPRDRGASWDFEDTRDHYLKALYGEDPARLRRENPARYLDLSRATTCEVMTETFAEWRRRGSSCNGALVWTLQDLLPGPGWGVIDSTGEPKPVWYALKRAFRPVQVLFSDEGVNGLAVHVLNDSAETLDLSLEIAALRDGRQPVVAGRRDLTLGARETVELPATGLFGAFFDTNYAYRFGPPSHDVVIARLEKASATIAEAVHFPLGRSKALHEDDIAVSLRRDDDGWSLSLTADRLQQSVHVFAEGFRPADDWFHLLPGKEKIIELVARPGTDATALPAGEVRALSGSSARF
ncbi:glycoside hydrolase family 2 protein [Rhizobiaceae bacterium BDR2-2]|uniref:beta-mannosidase n=1 Tax=Ectorhizobium quercum TaxID=2965071 RepID=A0AAE3SXZ2_9HYPH|nr:glycoside hydrolase family 2 protein [Ectorhizobium quercum]MCX8999624.1 glycoside hydrolase family 2 protein [Ectorhizobium quercum]